MRAINFVDMKSHWVIYEIYEISVRHSGNIIWVLCQLCTEDLAHSDFVGDAVIVN